jgi:hypothetical protein
VGVAIKPRFGIVFLMILLVLSLGSPAKDIPETAYDESEAPPYESVPLFSTAVPLVAARTTQSPLSSLHPKPGALFLFAPARVRDTDAHRSANARVLSALLCILLC